MSPIHFQKSPLHPPKSPTKSHFFTAQALAKEQQDQSAPPAASKPPFCSPAPPVAPPVVPPIVPPTPPLIIDDLQQTSPMIAIPPAQPPLQQHHMQLPVSSIAAGSGALSTTTVSNKAQQIRKRALHILKRDLHILKRALHILKRASCLFERDTFSKDAFSKAPPHILKRASTFSKRHILKGALQIFKSASSYTQKSLACLRKSPVYLLLCCVCYVNNISCYIYSYVNILCYIYIYVQGEYEDGKEDASARPPPLSAQGVANNTAKPTAGPTHTHTHTYTHTHTHAHTHTHTHTLRVVEVCVGERERTRN